MRLSEALEINRAAPAGSSSIREVHLVCGFTPLHLETFVRARVRMRFPESAAAIHTGLFGDIEGNLARAAARPADAAIVVIEWGDLDPRLDLRASAGWSEATLDDVIVQAAERTARLVRLLETLAAAMPVALTAPSLPLPPVTHFPPARSSPFELRLRAIALDLLNRAGANRNIRVASDAELALRSPEGARLDAALLLHAGFPYAIPHADAIAALCVECAFPAAPKKGLITDLDDTLWKGILGDVGVDGVSWRLDAKSHGHALYQQLLASLAESGVLIAVASKNDPELVETALARTDGLLARSRIFPVEAGWGAKSEAVGRILKAWNIGADSVVFIDDSPMELAEVAEAHPGMECMRFPVDKPSAIIELLHTLRALFGRPEVRDEDRLRLDSLRNAAEQTQGGAAEASEDFLRNLNAKIIFEHGPDSGRAFELVNKTNQFNLNGRRFTESEWKKYFEQPGAFLMTASYADRFGPLGKIAVIGGVRREGQCDVDLWVMSCRAFSRRIEFQMLKTLFETTGASLIRLRFAPTPRNGPTQDFLRRFFDDLNEGTIELSAELFERKSPPLFHRVTDNRLREHQTA